MSGNLTALRERDVLELRGNRLKCNPSQSDEGIFFDPVAGGAVVKATEHLTSGEKKRSIQRPAGLPQGRNTECASRAGVSR